MLPEWLAPDEQASFVRNHLGRAPFARPATAMDALPLFTWQTLDGVLGSSRPLDVLTVAGGETVQVRRPRSRGDVMKLMETGVSIVVRGAEQHDRGLARLAERFEGVMAGEVHVQLYATPA